jgi:uncharacterized protein YcgI (DUF1989 family)
VIVPAMGGRALALSAGERLRISTPKGGQAVDFFAFMAHDLGEWLSAPHTWAVTGSLRPAEGDTFLTRLRNPIARFAEDGAGGVHDMVLASCDAVRYRSFGIERDGCGDLMKAAMAELGHEIEVVPQPINFFTNIEIGPGLTIVGGPNPVPPGGYVVLEALADIVCAVTACPWDLSEPWEVNTGGLSEIEAVVLGP